MFNNSHDTALVDSFNDEDDKLSKAIDGDSDRDEKREGEGEETDQDGNHVDGQYRISQSHEWGWESKLHQEERHKSIGGALMRGAETKSPRKNEDDIQESYKENLPQYFSDVQNIFQEVRYFTKLSVGASMLGKTRENLPLQSFPGDFSQYLTHHREQEKDSGLTTLDMSRLRCRLLDPVMIELSANAEHMDRRLGNIVRMVQQCYTDTIEHLDDALQQAHSRIRRLTTDAQTADDEVAKLLDASLILERELGKCEEAKKELLLKHERERERLADEIGWLSVSVERERNRWRQYDALRRTDPTATSASTVAADGGAVQQDTSMHLSHTLPPASPAATTSDSVVGLSSPLASSRNTGTAATVSSPRSMPTSTISTPTKQLTQRQARDLIEEIYTSKTNFDARCQENRLPRETMEQHLYTYLTQKYGLKQIILEHAAALIQAIKRHGTADNDLAVFGRILRNEIDEEFRFVQRQLKETVVELLRVYLRGKYPLKVDSDIQNMLQRRFDGLVLLQEEEWVDIIKYMYNREDSVRVITRVRREIAAGNTSVTMAEIVPESIRQQQSPHVSGGISNSSSRITYRSFVQVLLDFQLRSHERFLRRFVRLFRQQDHDRNGVLDELQFRSLLLAINAERSEEDIDVLLETVDPFNNQHITFSECVALLSAELLQLAVQQQQEQENQKKRRSFGNVSPRQSPVAATTGKSPSSEQVTTKKNNSDRNTNARDLLSSPDAPSPPLSYAAAAAAK